jgi:hypothetical protein
MMSKIYSLLTTLVSLSVLRTLDLLVDEVFFFEQTTQTIIDTIIINTRRPPPIRPP